MAPETVRFTEVDSDGEVDLDVSLDSTCITCLTIAAWVFEAVYPPCTPCAKEMIPIDFILLSCLTRMYLLDKIRTGAKAFRAHCNPVAQAQCNRVTGTT